MDTTQRTLGGLPYAGSHSEGLGYIWGSLSFQITCGYSGFPSESINLSPFKKLTCGQVYNSFTQRPLVPTGGLISTKPIIKHENYRDILKLYTPED